MVTIRKKFILAVMLAVALLMGASVSQAEPRVISYASVYPEGSTPDVINETWAENVREYSNGSLSPKVYAMSLLGASEISAGVRDGIADSGTLLTVYFPSLYPNINLISESAMQLNLIDPERLNGKGSYAFEGAMTEYVFFKCPECLEELERQNHVYTANVSSSRYALVCNKPVVEAPDMEGVRVRVAGSQVSRWVSEFGGSSLSLTIGELREGLGQGVLDCTASSLPDILFLNLAEVVSDVTINLPGGVYAGASGASFNRDVWRSLTENQRRAVLRAGADLTALTPWRSEEQEAQAIEAVRAQGGRVHQASDAFREATASFVEQDLKTIVSYYEERYGVQRGQEKLDEFVTLLNKWVDLVQSVKSAEELADLYWDKIFSKVDVGSHGL